MRARGYVRTCVGCYIVRLLTEEENFVRVCLFLGADLHMEGICAGTYFLGWVCASVCFMKEFVRVRLLWMGDVHVHAFRNEFVPVYFQE